MTHEEQTNQAHVLFQKLIQTFLGRMATIFADQNLSLAQIRLLFVLASIEPTTINEIAEHLDTGQSATSLLVDKLVRAKFIERKDDPNDRRRAIIRLSSKGEALLEGKRSGQKEFHEFLSKLDESQLNTLIYVFTAMLASEEDEQK